MRISDWSSDVCSSDLDVRPPLLASTIIRLLRREDVAIVDLTNEPAGATDAEYDVVVTADADDGPAHLRLVLAKDGAGACEEPSVIALRRVTELVSRIELWRAARSEPAPGRSEAISEGSRVGNEWVSRGRNRG